MEIKSVTKINSNRGKQYLKALSAHKQIVLLLGSGISMWEPSNLPNGQAVTNDIANLIAFRTVTSKSVIVEMINSSAFEHIMECYPKPAILNNIIANAYHPTVPNPVHFSVAELLQKGIVEHIITTNYDEGIENACKTVCVSSSRKPTVVVYETDISRITTDKPVVFKIHGCAKPGRENSIIATLSTEGELPAWKRNLLTSLTKDKILLICGYSGKDFEISPELVNLRTKNFLWNSFNNPTSEPDAMTPNAYLVVSEQNGRVLFGSMHELFTDLNNKKCVFSKSSLAPSFIGQLKAELTPWEIDKWRVGIFNGLSCVKDAIKTGKSMLETSGTNKAKKLESLLALGEAYFQGGFYKSAIKAYQQAVKISLKANDLTKWVQTELRLIEFYSVAGYWFRANLRINKVYRKSKVLSYHTEPEWFESQVALKRVLLNRYLFRFFEVFRIHYVIKKIQKSVVKDLNTVLLYSTKNGRWFEVRQCQMLAKKFKVPFSDIYSGKMKTTSFRQGYKQLGYVLAEMMATRSEMFGGHVAFVEIQQYLNKAEELGINPEFWKMVETMKRVGGYKISKELEKKAKDARSKCEYTLPMRLLQKLFGDNA